MNLWELQEGQYCEVVGFHPEAPLEYRRGLLRLGLCPHKQVHCFKVSPFQGPKIYHLSGSTFALDKILAQYVLVGKSERK